MTHMNQLDCNTPNGRTYIQHSIYAINKLASFYCARAAHTLDTGIADIDAILIRDSLVIGLVEAKSRNMTKQQLNTFGSYLITHDKLLRGIALSVALQARFDVVVNLIPDHIIAVWNITTSCGEVMLDLNPIETTTQATCNGGSAQRINAFLTVDNAIFI